ncbi:hypothetical protein ACFLX9_04065 [Chloroflexota bacterium]
MTVEVKAMVGEAETGAGTFPLTVMAGELRATPVTTVTATVGVNPVPCPNPITPQFPYL